MVNLVPGTFSLNPNGVGLGQGKTYFRGFSDGQYTMTFDGIPLRRHPILRTTPGRISPAQWLGTTDFDRSPGLASNFGPTNFGGSINLQSKDLQPTQDIRATGSYGSFNTRLLPGWITIPDNLAAEARTICLSTCTRCSRTATKPSTAKSASPAP